MKRLLPVILGVFVTAGVVLAQEEKKGGEMTDPVEILKKVDAAAKAVNTARYKCSFERLGEQGQMPKVEGTVLLTGWSGGGPQKYVVDAKVKQPNSEEETRITVGGDGNEYFVVDHKSKKAYVDIDQAVMGRTGRPAQLILVAEFVHATPFSDEINGQKHELRGSKTIAGEDCYEVYVQYASAQQEAVWHFSKKDFLPRARLDIFKGPDGTENKQLKTISHLEVDPKIGDDAFKFSLPEGYERIDDFAP
jgi:outer membrane lipoprotein-sorting protein